MPDTPTALALGLLGLAGSYRTRLSLRFFAELPRLVAHLGYPVPILLPVYLLGPAQPGALFPQVALTLAAILIARAFAYPAVRAYRARGRSYGDVIIVDLRLSELHSGQRLVAFAQLSPGLVLGRALHRALL